MSMKEKTKDIYHFIRNHKRTSIRISAVFTAAVVFVCISYFYVVNAKYVTSDSAGNVIGANSFYFTSDYLNEAAYDGTVSEYVMHGWDGMLKKSFMFNIRNYDNPLLFNNKDQKVKYHFSYEILGNDRNLVEVSVYKIVNGTETAELDGVLDGGVDSYIANQYKLSIVSKNPAVPITHDVTVLLKVNTVESPYYAELSTKVTLQYSPFTDFIAEQGFEPASDANTDNGRAYGLIYYINTANEINNDEFENTDITLATEKIHLTWDNAKLEINAFDKKLAEIFAKKTVEEVLQNYENIEDCKNTIILDDNDTGHLYFDALAYSSFEIVLHKRKGIEAGDEIWKNANGVYLWDLNPAPLEQGNLVYAEVVN